MAWIKDESGAVTVDWVVLTAGLVGLGLATISVVSTGVQDTSEDVDQQLQGTIISTNFTQMEFSAWYAAIESTVAAQNTVGMGVELDPAERIRLEIAGIEEEIAEEGAEAYFGYTLPERHAAFARQAAMQALDRDTHTDEELAAALGRTTQSIQWQTNEGGYNGDRQAFFDAQAGFADWGAAQMEYNMQLADEHGFDYSGI